MQIAVVGAGIMGTGIAQVFTEAGLPVRLYARRRESLVRARERIAANQTEMRATGLAVDSNSLDRLVATDDLGETVGEAGFVSENVSENLALKQELFAELDRLAPADAILSTNAHFAPWSGGFTPRRRDDDVGAGAARRLRANFGSGWTVPSPSSRCGVEQGADVCGHASSPRSETRCRA